MRGVSSSKNIIIEHTHDTLAASCDLPLMCAAKPNKHNVAAQLASDRLACVSLSMPARVMRRSEGVCIRQVNFRYDGLSSFPRFVGPVRRTRHQIFMCAPLFMFLSLLSLSSSLLTHTYTHTLLPVPLLSTCTLMDTNKGRKGKHEHLTAAHNTTIEHE
jgi:hypothetical protein